MTLITKTTYYSRSWTTLRDFLKAQLTDPVTSSKSSTRKWIYNRIPKSRTFGGFPFVQVSDSSIDTEGTSFSTGKKARTIRFAVTIYSLKQDNISGTQLDTLSDELLAAFDSETTLSDAGMHNVSVGDSPVDEGSILGRDVLSRNFGIEFGSVLDVS